MKSIFVILFLVLAGLVALAIAGTIMVIWLMRQVDHNPHGAPQDFQEGFDD